MQFSKTIFRTVCIVGLAVATPAALAQLFPPRPGEPIIAPGMAPQPTPTQTPIVANNVPPASTFQKPQAVPQPPSQPSTIAKQSVEREDFREFMALDEAANGRP